MRSDRERAAATAALNQVDRISTPEDYNTMSFLRAN
jgi:hypothetical protein